MNITVEQLQWALAVGLISLFILHWLFHGIGLFISKPFRNRVKKIPQVKEEVPSSEESLEKSEVSDQFPQAPVETPYLYNPKDYKDLR